MDSYCHSSASWPERHQNRGEEGGKPQSRCFVKIKSKRNNENKGKSGEHFSSEYKLKRIAVLGWSIMSSYPSYLRNSNLWSFKYSLAAAMKMISEDLYTSRNCIRKRKSTVQITYHNLFPRANRIIRLMHQDFPSGSMCGLAASSKVAELKWSEMNSTKKV